MGIDAEDYWPRIRNKDFRIHLRPDTEGFGEKTFSEVRCMPEVPCKGGMGGLNTLFKPVGEKGDPYRSVNENWLWNGRDV